MPPHMTLLLKSLLVYIFSIPSNCFQQDPSRLHHRDPPEVLVHFAFAGSNQPEENLHRLRNLEFFLVHAVTEARNTKPTYRVTLNGNRPDARDLLNKHNSVAVHQKKPIVYVLTRENEGYHFGAHWHMLNDESYRLDLLGPKHLPYKAYVFLNDGVRGPFIPTYMPRTWHWTEAFTNGLTALRPEYKQPFGTGGIALLGTSIVCLNENDYAVKKDKRFLGPKVETFTFAMTGPALIHVLDTGTSFRSHKTKLDCIMSGEYNLTQSVMTAPHQWGISSLLLAYKNLNFRDKGAWMCNQNTHPSRMGSYGPGTSISPLEVIFHKSRWAGREVKNNEMEAYSLWKDEATHRVTVTESKDLDQRVESRKQSELRKAALHKKMHPAPKTNIINISKVSEEKILTEEDLEYVADDDIAPPAPPAQEAAAPPPELEDAGEDAGEDSPWHLGAQELVSMNRSNSTAKSKLHPSIEKVQSSAKKKEGRTRGQPPPMARPGRVEAEYRPPVTSEMDLAMTKANKSDYSHHVQPHEDEESPSQLSEDNNEVEEGSKTKDVDKKVATARQSKANDVVDTTDAATATDDGRPKRSTGRKTFEEVRELENMAAKEAAKRAKRKAARREARLPKKKRATSAHQMCECGWAKSAGACASPDGSYCFDHCCKRK